MAKVLNGENIVIRAMDISDSVKKRTHMYQPQTFIYSILDAVPPIHGESYHVATDKDPSMPPSWRQVPVYFWRQSTTNRGKKARGTLLADIGCSSKRAPLSVSYYNKISGGHIGSCRCSKEGLCRPSTTPVVSAIKIKLHILWLCRK